jgi:uncharacterized protein YjiS (DUF1127 family)
MREYAQYVASRQLPPGVWSIAFNLLRNWLARKEIAKLSKFDDHMLNDIGLTRGDLRCAGSLPLSVNPVHALKEFTSRG